MRLMQVLVSQAEAGAETYFEKVASAFAQDQTITQRLIIESLPSREQRLQSAGVDFRTLPMGFFSKALFYKYQFKKEVTEFNPDLIVTWANRASRKCPPTSAVVVGRIGGHYDIKNYRKCDHLFVNAPDLVKYVTDQGWPESQISMISNFGELPPALEVDEPLPIFPKDHKVLLTLGRLHPKKAQDVLIKALSLVSDTTLLIAGSGVLEGELKQLAIDFGVADRVHFLGLRKDVRQLFNVADLCVFPSRVEPLGNVVLEAWAMDTPIIAAASEGPSWLISDNKDGLLFKIDDVAQCAEKINLLLSSPDLAATLVKNGREIFCRRFSMEVILEQYKQLFEKLLAEKRE
ncbi:MAG: glycosyltransferase [Desulfuromusa sp.]|nr:glycosyltransferase [Desulfuromusa sp.]